MMSAMMSLPPVATGLMDSRNVRSGSVISDIGGYYDGQSIVRCQGSTHISCVFHHSHNHEGGPGLRVYHTISEDDGVSWSEPVPLEDSLTMPSHDSYQFTHPTAHSRVYVIYGYNDGQLGYTDPANGEHVDLPRGDMQLDQGFRLKYSNNAGRTFEAGRITIPVRRTLIDRANPWSGKTMGAFQCDKPSVIGESVYFAFQKTPEGGGETHNSEVWLMRSKDLLQKLDDPSTATWEVCLCDDTYSVYAIDCCCFLWQTLPRGDKGLQCNTPLAEHPWNDRDEKASFNLGEEPHIIQTDNDNPDKVRETFHTSHRCIDLDL